MNSQLLTLNSQILISTLNLEALSKLGTREGGRGVVLGHAKDNPPPERNPGFPAIPAGCSP